MRFKRLLALLLAAALALAVLVGCGSGQQSAAQALLKLLDGKYPNISIEIDPDLEADLRQAISQAEAENAGDDAAVIRAALEKLVGSTVTFRNLGEGQQGDTAFDLVFYAGTDIDKASQAAYSQWSSTFSTLPDDGKYGTGLAMVETNSGVWMLVKATVEKAGTVDKPDKDDDEPETQEPETGPTDVGYEDDDYSVTWVDETHNKKLFTVNADGNLENLFDTVQKENPGETFENIIIELAAGETYTVNTDDGPLAKTFKGELQGNGATVTITGGTQGLFTQIGDKNNSGTVQNVDIEVTGTINGSDLTGAVAGTNNGIISGCHVTISGSITSTSSTGGIVGYNVGFSGAAGTIQNCHVTIKSDGSIHGTLEAGGIAGTNGYPGTIDADCSVKLKGSGSIQATGNTAWAGGIVGTNNIGTVSCDSAENAHAKCSVDNNGTYTATVSAGDGSSIALMGDYGDPFISFQKAQAGTQCGKDGNRNSQPTSGPSGDSTDG